MTESRDYLNSTGISDEIYKLFPETGLANTIIRTAQEWDVDEIGGCAYDVLSKIKITDRNIGVKSIIRINEVLAKIEKKPRNTMVFSIAGLAVKKNNRYKAMWRVRVR